MNRRAKIIIAVSVLVVTALIVAASIINKRNDPPAANEYRDPLSGQTVSDPEGKTPESFGAEDSEPIYLGFDALLNRGLTFEQLNSLKEAFNRYSRSKPQPLDEISVDTASITSHRGREGSNIVFYLQFNVRVDRKQNYKARVDYTGLSSIRLYLTEPSGDNIIYDSQIVGVET